MELNNFVSKYRDLPVLISKVLLTGEPDLASMRVQLARWVKAGHLIQLRRGLYVLAPYLQKITPAPYFVASLLTAPSYVSLEKALAFHGLIPEAVFTMTCVTTKRPGHFETPLGRFDYQHVSPRLFWGYSSIVMDGQTGFIAHPEKALLDLLYLRFIHPTPGYLDELRLQNLEKIDTDRLQAYGRQFGKPGMLRAAQMLSGYITEVIKKERTL